MPNYIKNRIKFNCSPEEMQEIFKKFNTHYPASVERAHSGDIICRKKNGELSFGWLNERTGEFRRRGEKTIIGMPSEFEISINQASDRFPDFNKIVPRPEILDRTVSGSCHIDGKMVNDPIIDEIDEKDFNPKTMSKTDHFSSGQNTPGKISINRAPTAQELKELEEIGARTWYIWCNNNWGTKWNSADCEKISWNEFQFETAWSGVPDLIKKISADFPKTEIIYLWADEDSGSNVGDMTILGGEISEYRSPENQSNRAYEIYLSMNPDCDYIKMIDGKYQYVEEDE